MHSWDGGARRSRRASLGALAGVIALSFAVPAWAQADNEPLNPTGLGGYLAARQAERLRDHDSAARFILNAIAEDPDNPELLGRAVGIAAGAGNFDEAVRVARKLIVSSPANPTANLVIAVAEVRAGNYNAAEGALHTLSSTGPNRVLLPLMRGWIALGQGRGAAAVQVLEPAASVEGFGAVRDFHAALINDIAGDAAAAEADYRKVLGAGGANQLRVLEAAGNFFERAGKVAEARELYANALRIFPDARLLRAALTRLDSGTRPAPMVPDPKRGIAEALFDVAGALRQEAGGQAALVHVRLALALAPDEARMLLLAAGVLDFQGQTRAANALYERIPVDAAASYNARMRVAENLSLLGDTDEALKRLAALDAEEPTRIDAALSQAQILRSKERYAEAIAAYDRAIQRVGTPEQRHWGLFYNRGIAHERAKQWPRAEADFLKALELQPDQPDVLNYLAYTWVDMGVNLDRAKPMLERAVELRPNSGHIIDSLGWALYRLGKYAEAVPYLERAVELVPGDPTMLDHLGDALWMVGRINEARFQWRRALGNNPEADLKPKIEQKLQNGLASAPAPRGG